MLVGWVLVLLCPSLFLILNSIGIDFHATINLFIEFKMWRLLLNNCKLLQILLQVELGMKEVIICFLGKALEQMLNVYLDYKGLDISAILSLAFVRILTNFGSLRSDFFIITPCLTRYFTG